jgi:hypothetical protein
MCEAWGKGGVAPGLAPVVAEAPRGKGATRVRPCGLGRWGGGRRATPSLGPPGPRLPWCTRVGGVTPAKYAHHSAGVQVCSDTRGPRSSQAQECIMVLTHIARGWGGSPGSLGGAPRRLAANSTQVTPLAAAAAE